MPTSWQTKSPNSPHTCTHNCTMGQNYHRPSGAQMWQQQTAQTEPSRHSSATLGSPSQPEVDSSCNSPHCSIWLGHKKSGRVEEVLFKLEIGRKSEWEDSSLWECMMHCASVQQVGAESGRATWTSLEQTKIGSTIFAVSVQSSRSEASENAEQPPLPLDLRQSLARRAAQKEQPKKSSRCICAPQLSSFWRARRVIGGRSGALLAPETRTDDYNNNNNRNNNNINSCSNNLNNLWAIWRERLWPVSV